jgi:hypothetical protein
MAGETTVVLVGTAPLLTAKSVGAMVCQTHSVEMRTSDLALADVTGVAELPIGATLHGFHLKTDDLDTGTVALVWQILVGAVSVKTGIGNDAALIGAYYGVITEPVHVTAKTVVYAKATTAAATAAAGTFTITLHYTTTQ